MIEIDHLKAHILAHFIQNKNGDKKLPDFPFLCLTISGGHTQIVQVNDYHSMELIGNTIDDAAGEAFDKAAKIMSLPYPGGPVIDKLAKDGNPLRFHFPKTSVPHMDFSFSGLKTSILYFIRDELKKNDKFIEENLLDLCASIQHTIITILMDKLVKAAELTGINDVAIAGGVSANSEMRKRLLLKGEESGWNIFIPEFQFTTDNAAMIAIAGYYKYQAGEFAEQNIIPYARTQF